MSPLIFGVALAVVPAAPNLKDMPVAHDLYGEWDIEAAERAGRVTPITESPIRYRFNRDGTYECFRDGRVLGEPRGFSFDPKGGLAALDLNTPPAGPSDPHLLALFRIDGDRLAICIAGPRTPRPSELAAPPGADVHIVRFRRVRPKD